MELHLQPLDYLELKLHYTHLFVFKNDFTCVDGLLAYMSVYYSVPGDSGGQKRMCSPWS